MHHRIVSKLHKLIFNDESGQCHNEAGGVVEVLHNRRAARDTIITLAACNG